MLRLIYTLLLLTISSIGLSQVGNGVLFMTDAEYQFPGTTVDSTSTFEFQVVNDLGTPQTIFFSALDAPFSLLDNSPIEIPANDTATVMLVFEPTAIGAYNGSLEAVGSVFGSATLNFSGEGIQVVLDWTPASLVFDTTAIGQTNSQVVSITSSGNGDGVISAVDFSNPVFSVDSASSSFTIAEGATNDLSFVFAPTGAGAQSGTVTLHTNDPSNPQIILDVSGMGVSEVSGDICNMVWTAENSPYTLVGDVVVPEGCTLEIEAGVEIIGNDYDLEINGNLVAIGNDDNLIAIRVNQFIIRTPQGISTNLEHVVIEEFHETSWPVWFDGAFGGYWPRGVGVDSYYGAYGEDWSIDGLNGWSVTGGAANFIYTDNGYLQASSDYGYSAGSIYMQSPTFILPEGESLSTLELDVSYYWDGNCNAGSFSTSISVGSPLFEDGVETFTLQDSDCEDGSGWHAKNFNLTQLGIIGKEVRVNVTCYGQAYNAGLSLDNVKLYSHSYPETDVEFDDFASIVHTLMPEVDWCQGDITIDNCDITGGLHFGGDSLSLSIIESTIESQDEDEFGLLIFGDGNNIEVNQVSVRGFEKGLMLVTGVDVQLQAAELILEESAGDGITSVTFGGVMNLNELSISDVRNGLNVLEPSEIFAHGVSISNCLRHCIIASDSSVLTVKYGQLVNAQVGIRLGAYGQLNLYNSCVKNQGNIGLITHSPSNIDHCNVVFNEGEGLVTLNNNFHTLNNSIFWGNNTSNFTQIENAGGVISTSYSTVQGQSGYGVTGSGQFYWGEGVIEADPLFADDDLHLNTYSPCVDGGQPWLMDAHMPYGLGGVRADMGMYGGPDNAYWGGLALPDGASSLLTVQDSPQDQGNSVGLTFSSSFYDNSELVNNVTHYAFWRHFDPTGAPITDVAEGNWELLGEMPSLSLNNYAYQAATLGNTNAFGDFSSCYFVAAHTADDDTYWISNVMCGESVDNLAPDDPDLNGLVLETGEAQISWTPPTEEDYAYTEIYNDDGFTAEVGNDTLVLDPSVIPGYAYTYTAVNYDVNGNASDASSLTLEIPAGLDIIPLTAGWNLISTDRSASAPAIEDVLSSLDEGNVEYVTGFNNGVVLYEPDGFFIFNTLDEFESGFGYWIKVQEDDTLEIAGSLLTDGYMPSLNMGWNLIGYPNAENSSVETYFDQLLSDESLEYVTSFNQGSSYFDPNGLPFLNSLVELENGFGYWLKVSQAYDFNGLVTDQIDEPLAALSGTSGVTQPNPNYMLLNGTSNLAQEAGKQVLVHSLDGTIMGALPILEGGYLMTTALYGDDPATEALEGLLAGDEVYFSFEGKRSKEAAVYNGQMELRHINLEFEVQSQFEVFPNPFAEAITISGVLEAGGLLDAVITDSQGRMVAQRAAIEMTAGSYSLDWQLPRLAPGYYNCTVSVDGVTLDSMPIMHVEQ